MMCSLGHLQCGGNLGVRGSEKAGDLVGQRRIGTEPGELTLPEVEIAPGKSIEIACVVVFRGHEATIAPSPAQRRANTSFAPFACANRALSHCGIGANVICPT
jgi:hypothetical protein